MRRSYYFRMGACDYSLVRFYPGSGKTDTMGYTIYKSRCPIDLISLVRRDVLCILYKKDGNIIRPSYSGIQIVFYYTIHRPYIIYTVCFTHLSYPLTPECMVVTHFDLYLMTIYMSCWEEEKGETISNKLRQLERHSKNTLQIISLANSYPRKAKCKIIWDYKQFCVMSKCLIILRRKRVVHKGRTQKQLHMLICAQYRQEKCH